MPSAYDTAMAGQQPGVSYGVPRHKPPVCEAPGVVLVLVRCTAQASVPRQSWASCQLSRSAQSLTQRHLPSGGVLCLVKLFTFQSR
jgi:hypothetical protein